VTSKEKQCGVVAGRREVRTESIEPAMDNALGDRPVLHVDAMRWELGEAIELSEQAAGNDDPDTRSGRLPSRTLSLRRGCRAVTSDNQRRDEKGSLQRGACHLFPPSR